MGRLWSSKRKKLLLNGLKRINDLKTIANDIEVLVNENDFQDLVMSFDLEASIFSAEATLKSAISREESRGSHQRSDFKDTKTSEDCNYSIQLRNDEIEIKKINTIKVSNDVLLVIRNNKNIESFRGKLIE